MPGVQKLAVSRSWLAYRTPTEIHVRPVTEPGPGSDGRDRCGSRHARPARARREPRRLPPRDRRRQLDHRRRTSSRASACACATRATRSCSTRRCSRASCSTSAPRAARSSSCSGRSRGGRDKVLYELGPLAGPGRRARAPPHEPGRAPALPAQAARHGEDALDDRALADDRLRHRAPALPAAAHTVPTLLAISRAIGDNGRVGIISRGFHGRRQDGPPDRVPPGQYLTDDFPVLSAGPTPHTPLEEWTFDDPRRRGAGALDVGGAPGAAERGRSRRTSTA